MLAQRHKMRKADGLAPCPVQHGRDQCARLRDKGQLPRLRIDVGKAGVQALVRRQQADAIGPDDPQQVRLGRVQHGLLLRVVHAGGHDHGGAGAQPCQLVN